MGVPLPNVTMKRVGVRLSMTTEIAARGWLNARRAPGVIEVAERLVPFGGIRAVEESPQAASRTVPAIQAHHLHLARGMTTFPGMKGRR
jgi:hypothetical protein